MNQPGIVKENALTRLLDSAKQANQERGALAGRMSGTPVVPIGTRVQSGAMAAGPRFLSPEEQAELDKKLAAVTADAPPREETYESFEEAAAAGQPINRPDATPMTAREFMSQNPNRTKKIMDSHLLNVAPPSRLINFKRVQGIDLIRGVAYVDDFEIKIDPKDVRDMKKYVMDVAVAYVTQQLAEAVAELVEDDVIEVIEEIKETASTDTVDSQPVVQTEPTVEENPDGVRGSD